MAFFLSKYLGEFLFLVFFLISLSVYDDYGMTWDEPQQRAIGTIAYKYAFEGDKAMLDWYDKDYGVGYEMPLILIEKALGLKDTRDVFLMRHLITHLFFLLGAFFCFKTIDFLFENKTLAALGFLLIVLHPRLYAHSYFNTKDIPFFATFFICFYLASKAFLQQKMPYFICLGIVTGFLINMRIMGILVLVSVAVLLILDFFQERKKRHLLFFLVFTSVALLTLYITWPYLWKRPVNNFVEAFQNMSKFRWEGMVQVAGHYIKATDLPLWYLPLWFGITTPIIFILVGFLGVGRLAKDVVSQPLQALKNGKLRMNLWFLACFLAPVMAVLVLRSVMYDGWRQTYFVYAGLVMTMIYGLNYLLATRYAQVTQVVLGLSFTLVIFFMVNNHPYQQVYFNPIVSTAKNNHARKHYEMDYWGASYRSCLEYLLEQETTDTIKIFVDGHEYPAMVNTKILKPDERERIHFTTRDSADFFMSNFRWHYKGYPEYKGKEYYSVRVGNNVISEVYKLK